MRFPRLLLATALALVVALPSALVAGAASAADRTVRVKAFPTASAAYFLAGARCDGAGLPRSAPAITIDTATPQDPGLGPHRWTSLVSDWATAPAGDTAYAFGVGIKATTVAELDTFSLDVLDPQADAGHAIVFATPPGTPAGSVWVGVAPPSLTAIGADGWARANAAGASYTWIRRSQKTWTELGRESDTLTFAQFVTKHGGKPGAYSAMIGYGCDNNDVTYDGFRWGPSRSVSTLDFESLRCVLSIRRTPATVVAGAAVTLTGTLGYLGAGQRVTLQAKAYGASAWHTVRTLTTGAGGAVRASAKPLTATSYRWSYAGNTVVDPGTSTAAKVAVAPKVTATLDRTRVRRGAPVTVTGTTRPATPGAAVTLWRQSGERRVRLTAAKVRASGAYTLRARLSVRGTEALVVTVAAHGGTVRGTSPVRRVHVG